MLVSKTPVPVIKVCVLIHRLNLQKFGDIVLTVVAFKNFNWETLCFPWTLKISNWIQKIVVSSSPIYLFQYVVQIWR